MYLLTAPLPGGIWRLVGKKATYERVCFAREHGHSTNIDIYKWASHRWTPREVLAIGRLVKILKAALDRRSIALCYRQATLPGDDCTAELLAEAAPRAGGRHGTQQIF